MMNIIYIHLDRVDSTNNWVKEHTAELRPFTCVTAREQTAGRGRFERHWISPRDQNIYASLYLKGCHSISNIGQIMALSCAKMLRSLKFTALIKWPNDIVIGQKKIGGVLTETMGQDVVVGVGLNVNMDPATLATIGQPATSLAELSGKQWDIQVVLELLMQQFLKDLAMLQKEGFKPFQKVFEESLAYKGQEITCRDGARVIKGICHSMTEDGRLQLLLPSGEFIALTAGEITTSNQKQ